MEETKSFEGQMIMKSLKMACRRLLMVRQKGPNVVSLRLDIKKKDYKQLKPEASW